MNSSPLLYRRPSGVTEPDMIFEIVLLRLEPLLSALAGEEALVTDAARVEGAPLVANGMIWPYAHPP